MLRKMLGVGLLGLGAWSVLPGLIHPISSDAVVNAEVVTLRAPVEGRLAVPGTLNVGERVAEGDILASIGALRPETARRDALKLDLTAQRRLVDALAQEQAELARLDRELAGRAQAFRGAEQERLSLSRLESGARLRAIQAEAARKQALVDKDLLAPTALEPLRAQEQAARAELERVIAAGRAARHGADDSPYADQRRDEIRVKRAARQVEIAQAQIRVVELERQLAAEEALAARLSQAGLAAPVSGVVWQRFAAEGDSVRPGDPVVGLVDCKSLFLTAVLPKRFFAEIKSGDHARARVSGVEESVSAVVQSVRAGGGAQANGAAAITPASRDGSEVVVTLAVRDPRLGNRSDNLCQVGQHATITFDMPALKPWINAVAQGVLGNGRAS